jgi:hypothetical protein
MNPPLPPPVTPVMVRWPDNDPALCVLGDPHQPDGTGTCLACGQPC